MLLFVQPAGAFGVVFNLIRMSAAIDLDHQLRFGAEEIDDVGADGVLFSEMCAIQLLAAKTLANIDGDPDLEAVVGTTYAGLVAYDLPGTAKARILWGTGRGSYLRSGLAPAPYYIVGTLEGSVKSVSDSLPDPGEALTYTIRLINPGPSLPAVHVTDTLPINAVLVSGSVHATSGSWSVGGGMLRWNGAVSQSIGVTVTYVMTLSSDIALPTVVLNTALINDGLRNVITRTAAAVVSGYGVYLPVVRK